MAEPRREINIHAVIVDVSSERERRAREAGAQAMTMEPERSENPTSSGERFWRHNLLREFYRQKEIVQARAKIKDVHDLVRSPAEADDTEAEMRAAEALLLRFKSEAGEFIHETAGEKKKTLGMGGKEGQFRIQIENLLREYVRTNMSDEDFQREKKKYLTLIGGFGKEHIDTGEMYADNLLELAHEVKQAVETGTALENIDFKTEVTLGRARLGARTETEYTRVDRVMEKLNRSPLKPFHAKIGQALGLVDSMLTFVNMGSSERDRLIGERRQHVRDRAIGLTYDPRDKRRAELEQTRYETKTAQQLIAEIDDALTITSSTTAELKEITRERFVQLTSAKAELEERMYLSEKKKIDRIQYTDGRLEEERLELDAANVRARVALRGVPRNKLMEWTGGRTLEEYISAIATQWSTCLTDVEPERVKKAIATLKGAKNFVGVRTPLAKPVTEEEAAERARLLPSSTTRALPATPRPTPPVVTPPATPPLPDAGRTPEPPRVEAPPAPPRPPETRAQRAHRELGAGLAWFSAEGGHFFGERVASHAERQKAVRSKIVDAFSPPDPEFAADIMRLTGEDLDTTTLDLLVKSKNIAELRELIYLYPERASQIPWADTIVKIEEEIVGDGVDTTIETWYTVLYPLLQEGVANGALSMEKPEDGERFTDFLKGFGPVNAPELLKAFLAWDVAQSNGENLKDLNELKERTKKELAELVGDDATKVSRRKSLQETLETLLQKIDTLEQLQELFGADALKMDRKDFRRESLKVLQEKTKILFSGEKLPKPKNDLEEDWDKALTKQFETIRARPEFANSAARMARMLEVSEREPGDVAVYFAEQKKALLERLDAETARLREQITSDSRVKRGAWEHHIARNEDAKRILSPLVLSEDVSTWEPVLRTAARAQIADDRWDEVLGSVYLAAHRAERLRYAESALTSEDVGGVSDAAIEQALKAVGKDVAALDLSREHPIPAEMASTLSASMGIGYLHIRLNQLETGAAGDALLYRQLLRSFGFTGGGDHPLISMEHQLADFAQLAPIDYPKVQPSEAVMQTLVVTEAPALLNETFELLHRVWGLELLNRSQLRNEDRLLCAMMKGTLLQVQKLYEAGNTKEAYELLLRAKDIKERVVASLTGDERARAEAEVRRTRAAAPVAVSAATGGSGTVSGTNPFRRSGTTTVSAPAASATTAATSSVATAASTASPTAAKGSNPFKKASSASPAPTAVDTGTVVTPAPTETNPVATPAPAAAPVKANPFKKKEAPAPQETAPVATPAATPATPARANPFGRKNPAVGSGTPAAEKAPAPAATPEKLTALPDTIKTNELKGFPERVAIDAMNTLKETGMVTAAMVQADALRTGDTVDPKKVEALLDLLVKKGIAKQKARNKKQGYEYIPGSLDPKPEPAP